MQKIKGKQVKQTLPCKGQNKICILASLSSSLCFTASPLYPSDPPRSVANLRLPPRGLVLRYRSALHLLRLNRDKPRRPPPPPLALFAENASSITTSSCHSSPSSTPSPRSSLCSAGSALASLLAAASVVPSLGSFFVMTCQCIQLCMYLLVGISLLWTPGSCVLGDSLSSKVAGSPNSNSNERNSKAISPVKKFLMQSYYDRYINLVDSDVKNFLSQEANVGSCEVFRDKHNSWLRLSILKRDLIGEGSHRHVSTLVEFETHQSESLSQFLLSYSCEFIIVERLPHGVFADAFELQRLAERGVFKDVAVFGDTNLELPSFLSNRSAVEIHLGVNPNLLVEPTKINIELPLHARYQPLDESGYTRVKFDAPDMFMGCSPKEKLEDRSCFIRLTNGGATNLNDAGIVWIIPSGKKSHSGVVSAITFMAAMLSTLAIVVTSLHYSNRRLGNLKQS